MGIFKVKQPDGSLFITPSCRSARKVIAAGARLVALDGTPGRGRVVNHLRDVVAAIHAAGGAALADCRHDRGRALCRRVRRRCGRDDDERLHAGQSEAARARFRAARATGRDCPVPVFAEGRIWTREEARKALDLGASFVVVGTAITNPTAITARFVAAIAGVVGTTGVLDATRSMLNRVSASKRLVREGVR